MAAGEEPVEAAGATLLVVDDSQSNRDILARWMRQNGFRVLSAPDGPTAIEIVARERIDVVLLDAGMPGMDGFRVLARLRETHDPAKLPVILLTAGRSTEEVRALENGANDYVARPADPLVVLARARTQLSLKQKIEETERLASLLAARNGFIRKVFGRYLTDEVVESLLDRPGALDLGGTRRKVTILMSDLRGFSAFSERCSPEDVIRFLNAFLDAMCEVIARHGGIVDEFIGDAILTIFGALDPRADDAERAVACALGMQIALDDLNRDARHRGLAALEMGIAVHTGEVVVGNIGCERRAKYGAVGTNVNVAGRIQSFSVGRQVLVSEATMREVEGLVRVGSRFDIRPKGMTAPIQAWEVTGIGGRFAVELAEEADEAADLAEPLDAEWVEVDDKHVTGRGASGRAVRVSARHAVIEGEEAPDLHASLRVRLSGLAGVGRDDLYGKVVASAAGRCTVRFTSVPPAAGEALRGIVHAARGGGSRERDT